MKKLFIKKVTNGSSLKVKEVTSRHKLSKFGTQTNDGKYSVMYFIFKGEQFEINQLQALENNNNIFLDCSNEVITICGKMIVNNETIYFHVENNKIIPFVVISYEAGERVNSFNNTDNNVVIDQLKNKTVVPLDDFESLTGVRFTTVHTGKMENMISLSTNAKKNSICRCRAKVKNSICTECYANDILTAYPDLYKKTSKNMELLTYQQLDILPQINKNKMPYIRFEAFGDLANINQLINYINIARVNPSVQFALWTKNPFILSRAAELGFIAPGNMNVMYSSYFLNSVTPFNNNLLKLCNGVFTVYTNDFLENNNKSIVCNCGDKKCKDCLLCYKKHDNFLYINERLK